MCGNAVLSNSFSVSTAHGSHYENVIKIRVRDPDESRLALVTKAGFTAVSHNDAVS